MYTTARRTGHLLGAGSGADSLRGRLRSDAGPAAASRNLPIGTQNCNVYPRTGLPACHCYPKSTTSIHSGHRRGRRQVGSLALALEGAGLVETLQCAGPATVFASTGDTFAKLSAGTVEALVASIPALTGILLYAWFPAR